MSKGGNFETPFDSAGNTSIARITTGLPANPADRGGKRSKRHDGGCGIAAKPRHRTGIAYSAPVLVWKSGRRTVCLLYHLTCPPISSFRLK